MATDTMTRGAAAPTTSVRKQAGPPTAFGKSGFGAAAEEAERKRLAGQEAAEAARRENDPYHGMTPKERKAARKAAKRLTGKFKDYAALDAIRPNEGYAFKSDYFSVDGQVACILGFFHDDSAKDDFPTFWGIGQIPNGLDDTVSVVVMEQVRVMGEKWIDERLKTVERLDKMEEKEQAETGTMRSKRKTAKVANDMETVAAEIADGASYLHVHKRLLVKAPDIETLDKNVEKINSLYVERFSTLKLAAYHAEQRRELGDLFRKNEKKRGKGFHFTSTEYAGSHHLVTNGLNDPTGEYVGYMVGDVNTSAVLLDVNQWERRVVIADPALSSVLGRSHVPSMWGSKISQSALLNNQRVVHIVLDGSDLDKLGPKLDGITARMDLTRGDMNMFEVFGEAEDELALFSQHVQKITLMAEQAYAATDAELGSIRNSLSSILTEFYVDQKMWASNAKDNRDRLRLVGIPHAQVPQLKLFKTYLDRKYEQLKNELSRDPEELHAIGALRGTFTSMLENNGDLFNTLTSDSIDGVRDASRVIYDFSELMARGTGIAMAQLVNVIGYAVSRLGLGDVVVVHGTEKIRERDGGGSKRLKEFIDDQFERLMDRGGRVAYLYNSIDKMVDDVEFNRFDDADFTILGAMRESTVKKYLSVLQQVIPPDLERLITRKGENLSYLRRGQTNVVFWLDLPLGVNPARKKAQKRVGMGKRPVRDASVGRGSASGTARQDQVELNAVMEAKQQERDRRRASGGEQRPKKTLSAPRGNDLR